MAGTMRRFLVPLVAAALVLAPTAVSAVTTAAPVATIPAVPVFHEPPPEFYSIKMTHAVFAPLVFALFMPAAAIIIRTFPFRGAFSVHVGIMIASWFMSLIALGTGIYLAQFSDLMTNPHSIIGFVVIGGCTIQPFTGWIHHQFFKRTGAPSTSTFAHVWLGRALVTLGAINGGLGLHLAWFTPQSALIGYGIGTAVVWLTWMGALYLASKKSRGQTFVYGEENIDDDQMKHPSEMVISAPALEKDPAAA